MVSAAMSSVEATMPTDVASAVVRVHAAEIAMMGWVGVGSCGRTGILEQKRIERAGANPGARIFPQLRFIALPRADSERERNQDDDDEQSDPHRVIPHNQYTSGDSSPNSSEQRTSADVFVVSDQGQAFSAGGTADDAIGGVVRIVAREDCT